MKRFLAAAAVLIASATGADVAPRPLQIQTACRADGDCVLTHFQGCCAVECCRSAPRAIASAELNRQQNRCAVIECAARSCPDVKCEPPEPDSNFRAVCRQSACQLERVTAAAECTSNGDCMVEYPSGPCSNAGPCGCCPGTQPRAVAVSKMRDEAPAREPRPVQPAPKQGEPKFGLTQGGPTAPNCAPCPSPRPATAVCTSGRCVLGPVVRPTPPPPG